MMNTMLNSFAAKRNTNIIGSIFDKYFKHFVTLGYTKEDSSLIADLFQTSADKGLDMFVHEYMSTSKNSKGKAL